ncbi:FtsX-like permease family protein [Streptomyces sp. NPDC002911]
MWTTLRWLLADLRAHRGEALFVVLATSGIVVSLLMAGALVSYASDPWQRVFSQSKGAHVVLHTRPGTDVSGLREQNGVTAVSGPFRTAQTSVQSSSSSASVELREMPVAPPAVGRPVLAEGHWPARGANGRIVLESGVAQALWAEPGDLLTLSGKDGSRRSLTVTGIADSAELPYAAGKRPGVGWVSPGEVDSLALDASVRGQFVALRLSDPADTDFAVQRAVTVLGADNVVQVADWRRARAETESDDRLLGLLVGLFATGALLAAALAVVGAISTRIRSQLRDISVLKAIGFTPGHVVRVFLIRHLSLALLGAALGTVSAETLGASVPGRVGEAVGMWQELPGRPWSALSIPAAAVLFIGIATALAAWRAGRVPSVPASPSPPAPSNQISALTRSALGLRGVRLPPSVVLGWRGAFPRRARTLASTASLALPLLLITVALGTLTTIDRFQSRPGELGLAASLTARAGDGMDDAGLRALLESAPDVSAAHPGSEVTALVPGQTGTLSLRGLGTLAEPYPFALAEGRAVHGPDEAVAGQGMIDLLGIETGDWVRMTVAGRPQILHIVGRVVEPENGGRIISTSMDTLWERSPSMRPDFYQLRLRQGADPDAVRKELVSAAGGGAEIRAVSNPADRLTPARGVIAGLVGVLVLIGLTELLSMVGAILSDRRRDLFALRAIGLTPRQVIAVVMAAGAFKALAAALLATALGGPLTRWLIDKQAASMGIGSGVAELPPPWVLLAVVGGSCLAALLAAALPATRAARHRLGDTLGTVI